MTINITMAFLILMLTMNVHGALEFSIFPSLLLVTTLFRLALNVSSTRLILLHANAGKVIQALGILWPAITRWLVLSSSSFDRHQFPWSSPRGAERVAEVAARFTLAMPGKQMSIDADPEYRSDQ